MAVQAFLGGTSLRLDGARTDVAREADPLDVPSFGKRREPYGLADVNAKGCSDASRVAEGGEVDLMRGGVGWVGSGAAGDATASGRETGADAGALPSDGSVTGSWIVSFSGFSPRVNDLGREGCDCGSAE